MNPSLMGSASLVIPPRAPSIERRTILQSFECVVISRSAEGEFEARLKDLTDGSMPDEAATFSIEEVSEGDRELVAPGAIFYWFIGYETSRYGQRSRKSFLRFRRLPGWTKVELDKLDAKASELADLFGVDRIEDAGSRR